MLKSSKANMLASMMDRQLKKQRKARVEKDYAAEIERCEEAIKEAVDIGKMECFIKELVISYAAANEIEWYLEQYGYRACREKNLNGPGYDMVIKWY